MKKLLSLALISGLFLTITGCVDEVAVTSRRDHRPGYYADRRSSTYYETRPVYRERPAYYDDGYYGRGDVRVYDAPRPRHSDVRVVF